MIKIPDINLTDNCFQDYLDLIYSLPQIEWEDQKKIFADFQKIQEKLNNCQNDLEKEELERVKKGYRDTICELYLPLVVKMVKESNLEDMELLDAIQEGTIGLMNAIEKYDYSKGNRFITYAYMWIKQAIEMAVANTAKLIRVPYNTNDKIKKIINEKKQLEDRLGKKVSLEELSLYLGIDISKLKYYFIIYPEVISMDKCIADDTTDTLQDYIPADISVEEEVISKDISEQLKKFIEENLSEIDSDIIKMRYGISDGEIHSYTEIGKKYNRTFEAMRKREKRALMRLRKILLGREEFYGIDKIESSLVKKVKE